MNRALPTAEALRALQKPLKDPYREDPGQALETSSATARLAGDATTAKLLELTERHCVIAQTLVSPPPLEVALVQE